MAAMMDTGLHWLMRQPGPSSSPKRCKLANSARLRQAVASKLRLNWSPAGRRLAEESPPGDESYHVSRDDLSQSVCSSRGVLEGAARLSRSRRTSAIETGGLHGDGRGRGTSSQSVSDRQRLKIGRLVIGKAICCRGRRTVTSRPWSNVIPLRDAGEGGQQGHPDGHLCAHKQARSYRGSCKIPDLGPGQGTDGSSPITLATDIEVYSRSAESLAARSNENTNGLLRQYFPKGTDLSVHSQAHLNKVARQLNERPRETCNLKPQRRV